MNEYISISIVGHLLAPSLEDFQRPCRHSLLVIILLTFATEQIIDIYEIK